jgi:hypothetical protein
MITAQLIRKHNINFKNDKIKQVCLNIVSRNKPTGMD